jgi:guanine deaminase
MAAETDFMREALALAVENVRLHRGGPFAALVVRQGTVIARGTNLVTSTNDPTAHAEVVALRAACKALGHFQLTGCDLYTTCEPCPMCLGAIYWARPAQVFYAATREDAARAGFDDAFIYDELRLPVPQRHIPFRLLPTDAVHRPFLAWQSLQDRIPY